MAIHWMPIMGEFEILPNRITFKGRQYPAPDPPQGEPPRPPQAAVGILVSDQKMANGSLHAKVEFDRVVTGQSVCELIVRYDVKSKAQITAGLGGSSSWAMFSIREWVPASSPQSSPQWANIELTGDRVNLRAGVPYGLVVRVQGSSLSLEVDNVEVATATLPTLSSQSRQVGIFCVSEANITISDFRADVERPQAFIVMQFSSPYNEVYSHVVKDLCDELRIEAVRADEIYGPGIIIKDVIDRIARSQVVIADISPPNPNVYFEVGYALALGKPIILLAQRRAPDAPLPFDISAFRVLFYEDTISGKPQLEVGLRKHLSEILGQD